MSRRHEVVWTCDRCGVSERVKAKTDTHLPEGWRQTENHLGLSVDLCSICLGSFGDLFEDFMNELKPPAPEPRTIVNDELNELDPEVNDG